MVNFLLAPTTLLLVATATAMVSASPVINKTSSSSQQLEVRDSGTSDSIRELQKALLIAPSNADREALLFSDPWSGDATNITFRFVNNSVSAPTGGSIDLSSVDTFPALVGVGMTMAIGFVNPCGLNTPHSHPRANEFLTVVQGKLIGSLILEDNPGGSGNVNGSGSEYGAIPQVNAELENYKGMIFPIGLTHFQFNPTCEPAVFAAAFDSNDPGRTQLARNFFSITPDEILEAAVGGNLETLDASRLDALRKAIPGDTAVMMEECAQKCGISTSG